MNNFIVNRNHPVQKREQTFTLDRKILTVHSFDRDINKWPNANCFEIDLPEPVTNIQSIRLVQISIPSNQLVFSNEYQNTKMTFTHGGGEVCTITISEGSYTARELAIEITQKMNYAIIDPSSPVGTPGTRLSSYPSSTTTQGEYIVKYNDITNTFWFGNTTTGFTLNFDKHQVYNTKCNQPEVWFNYTKWGFPSYIGYKRKEYVAKTTETNDYGVVITGTIGHPYVFTYEWDKFAPSNNAWLGDIAASSISHHFVGDEDTDQIDIYGEQCMYMEIEKFNSMDEMEPYSENTMGIYNNDLNGKVKAAFAKIPLSQTQFTQLTENRNNGLTNISHYNPVIERIDRLKFKFRYHDGRLVDFKTVPFNFSIEFNTLRDRQARNMTIVVPPLYSL